MNICFEEFALEGADLVVHGLRRLITWLMGAPAGLKLNSVLSHSLGKFFLYHIHLWRTFLHVITPYVSHFLHTGLEWKSSSAVGLCIQLSFAQGTKIDSSIRTRNKIFNNYNVILNMFNVQM